MLRLPALCCKLLDNSTPSPRPAVHPLKTVLSGLLEILSPGLEVLKIPTE